MNMQELADRRIHSRRMEDQTISALKRAVEERAQEVQDINREREHIALFAFKHVQEPIERILRATALLEKHSNPRLGSDAARQLEEIMGAAHRATKLLNGLVNFSRAGARRVEFRTVALQEVVRNVLSDM